MSMEKRNVIESGRTPQMDKQAAEDRFEQHIVDAFIDTHPQSRRSARKPLVLKQRTLFPE